MKDYYFLLGGSACYYMKKGGLTELLTELDNDAVPFNLLATTPDTHPHEILEAMECWVDWMEIDEESYNTLMKAYERQYSR